MSQEKSFLHANKCVCDLDVEIVNAKFIDYLKDQGVLERLKIDETLVEGRRHAIHLPFTLHIPEVDCNYDLILSVVFDYYLQHLRPVLEQRGTMRLSSIRSTLTQREIKGVAVDYRSFSIVY